MSADDIIRVVETVTLCTAVPKVVWAIFIRQ